MFGRRRHVAPALVASAPQLTEDAIFDIVHAQVAAAIGEHGEWTLTRRAPTDSDQLFYGVVAHSVTTHVVEALRIARENLAASEHAVTEIAGDHVARPMADAPAPDRSATSGDTLEEPAAFGWRPAPITVWTDLKRPVTGPIAHIHEHELVA
ncbi:hypothetical protein [Rathayibacter soli]|uniref:hypothetical protein n=1 Tax=Rathayibacter soli TaxID=3144168 RepID=UPI0027E5BB4D|nr:hypothetical protein [Glaciibacter superstes]